MRRSQDRANRRRQHHMIKRGRIGLKNRAQKRIPLPVDLQPKGAIVTAETE